MPTCKLIALVFVLISTALCQPVISPKGIVNTASFTPPDLPGGTVAAGSMVTITGQALGPATAVTASSSQLDTNLAGVTVQITQNDQVTAAYPVYVSDTRIRAVLPGNTPLG